MSTLAIESRPGTFERLRNLLPTKEAALFVIGALLIAVHMLDDAFVHPESGSSATDNLITGIAGVAAVAAIAAAYARLGTGWRAAAPRSSSGCSPW